MDKELMKLFESGEWVAVEGGKIRLAGTIKSNGDMICAPEVLTSLNKEVAEKFLGKKLNFRGTNSSKGG